MRSIPVLLLIAVSAAQSQPAGDSLRARVDSAVARYERGDRDAAKREFTSVIAVFNARASQLTSRELVAVAVACTYLGVENPQAFKDALLAFDRAIAADPTNLDARVRLAELFLSKYNSADAKQTIADALARNRNYVAAILADARRRMFDNERGADSLVTRALQLEPANAAARLLHARFLADAEGYTAARDEVDLALTSSPNDADALAYGAALRRLAGDSSGAKELERRYDSLFPREADVFVTRAEMLGRIRQYAAAAEAAREGTRRDPTNWRAHALLGMNLLRLGDVAGAKASLETSFKGDPYDVWTKNTLDLLDTFANYDEIKSPRFTLVIERQEAGLLGLYLGELAERAYTTFSTKYGFAPPVPVRVEVYRSHADFSVRTVGLTGLGALGVSFGNTVAFDSPAARDAGTFTWGSTAWHELAHTFTLGASEQRVPRWLSEGLSVYEERRARPGWGMSVTPAFLDAYAEGKLVPASKLNDGFVRPAYPQQVIFSYYEASLVCELIARDWGERALVDMLRAYRSGVGTDQVLRRVLHTDPAAFDKRFDAYLRERFGERLASLKPYRELMGQGRTLMGASDTAGARVVFERARALFPEYGGAEGAYPQLARLALARGDRARAAELLGTMVTAGEAPADVHRTLARLLLERGDTTRAADALDRLMFVDPYTVDDHQQLASLYERLGDRRKVVRERLAVVALSPVDRADALYQLAVAYRDAGDAVNARHAVIQSLEEAPHFERAQELLLALHEAAQGAATPASQRVKP